MYVWFVLPSELANERRISTCNERVFTPNADYQYQTLPIFHQTYKIFTVHRDLRIMFPKSDTTPRIVVGRHRHWKYYFPSYTIQYLPVMLLHHCQVSWLVDWLVVFFFVVV